MQLIRLSWRHDVKWRLLFLSLTLSAFFSIALCRPSHGGNYKVGPEDVLEISVYDQPDLSKTVRVSPEGIISFPLLGSIKVEGYTVTMLEALLSDRLSEDFLVNPQVSIFIKAYRSRKIYVLGEVMRPGVQELTGPMTLLEAISRVGGIKSEAGKVAIISQPSTNIGKENEEDVPLKINLTQLLEKGDAELNVELEENAVIHIPKANSFFVFGEVKKPGSYIINEDTTVLQAVTMAGGFTKIAAPSRTRIIRVEDGKEQTINIDITEITKRSDKNLDIKIKRDDIIVVPESFF